MARVAEYDGTCYEVVSFAHDFNTGQDLVVMKLYWKDLNELLRHGATYSAAANWVIPVEQFNERFVWVDA